MFSGIDALAAVHGADWRGLGFEFLDKSQYGPVGLEQQLNYYEAYLRWTMGDAPEPGRRRRARVAPRQQARASRS